MLNSSSSQIRWSFVAGMAAIAAQTAMPAAAQATRPASGGDWSMFRGDPANTGVARGGLPEKPSVLWKFTVAPDEAFESSAAIVGGIVYVGCSDKHLYAVDLRTGKVRWKHPAKAEIKSSPLVADGRVIFGDEAGVVNCIDAASGEPRWVFATQESVVSSPLPYEANVIVGSYDGSLYCLKRADGSLVWKYETADKLHAAPAIVGGQVLISGCDGFLHVVNAEDGKAVRKVDLGAPCGAAAAVKGTTAVAGTQGNQVVAVDFAAEKRLWTFEDEKRQFPFMASAAITNSLAIVGGRDKVLRAFEIDSGKVRWSMTAKGRFESSAVVVGDRVFVPTSDGVLLALDVKDGKEHWRYEAGGGFVASPAVAEGRLVIGSVDGILYCFGGAVDAAK